MKILFWDKLPNNKLVKTIWMHVFSNKCKVILKNINEIFEDKKIIKKITKNMASLQNQKIDLINDDTRK